MLSDVGTTDPGGGLVQEEIDSESGVLLDDTAVVSRGILGFGDVGLG